MMMQRVFDDVVVVDDEVEMEVEGEAEGSVVELEKRMKEKTDLTQEEEIQKNKRVKTKMF